MLFFEVMELNNERGESPFSKNDALGFDSMRLYSFARQILHPLPPEIASGAAFLREELPPQALGLSSSPDCSGPDVVEVIPLCSS